MESTTKNDDHHVEMMTLATDDPTTSHTTAATESGTNHELTTITRDAPDHHPTEETTTITDPNHQSPMNDDDNMDEQHSKKQKLEEEATIVPHSTAAPIGTGVDHNDKKALPERITALDETIRGADTPLLAPSTDTAATVADPTHPNDDTNDDSNDDTNDDTTTEAANNSSTTPKSLYFNFCTGNREFFFPLHQGALEFVPNDGFEKMGYLGYGRNGACFKVKWNGTEYAMKQYDIGRDGDTYFSKKIRAYMLLRSAWGILVPRPIFLSESLSGGRMFLGLQLGFGSMNNALFHKFERVMEQIETEYGIQYDHSDDDY